MRRADILWLAAAALAAVACGEREAPPPPPAAAAAPVVDSLPVAPDTLQGDSIMARDTARVPQ